MAVIFKEKVRHGRETILPGVAVAFDDPNADAYFVALGAADETGDTPVHTYPIDAVSIDPETVFADGPNKGRAVIGG